MYNRPVHLETAFNESPVMYFFPLHELKIISRTTIEERKITYNFTIENVKQNEFQLVTESVKDTLANKE